ncbi:thioesterase family protein [Diplocarpon rosae]|nr:thioesterase family protein [Diplocarpon rosae]
MITRLPIRASSQSTVLRTISQPSRRCLWILDSQASSRLLLNQLRSYSTPAATLPPADLRSQFPSAPPSPPPIQPTPKRSLRPYIYATFFLLLGLTAGQYARLILAPPPLPPAGSKEDSQMVSYLHTLASKLPLVESLSADPSWTAHDAYTSLSPTERATRLTTGALAGARALGGYQRVFHNTETGEMVSVVWFGGAIAGWPGVTHGGATATIMDESLGRCAVNLLEGRTGVTANLEMNYLKPIVTNSFYVVRAVPEIGGNGRKAWVRGRLETMDGKVCVESRALFVVPKKLSLREIRKEF